MVVGGSFNGRTPDSDSANRGSTPRPPANHIEALEVAPLRPFLFVGDFVT